MRVLIFHYHLNPGGVTRIIESQVIGLKKLYPELEILVLTGACENLAFYKEHQVELHVNPVLNYLFEKDFTKSDLLLIEKGISEYLSDLILPEDILHVHNLNLGKNPVFTKVLLDYHKMGHILINHAHDFAEDRPENQAYMKKVFSCYFDEPLHEIIYPKNESYKVGILNRFDYNRILEYGIRKENAFLLPNPVLLPSRSLDKMEARASLINKLKLEENKKIITYPVRVIRRKNIGELILLAMLFKDTCQFLVTLPPQNPVEIEFYEQWVSFCEKISAPIIFEAGKKAKFEEILSGSDYCISTSIQEGFGMAYLEPWTFNTPVIGRDISSITVDLIKEGVEFPLIYSSILIDSTDFKDLSYGKQKELISKVASNKKQAESIIKENLFLTNFPPKISKEIIEKNKKTISINFSVEKYAQRLYRMYS